MTVGQGPAAPGRIFISYRREETAYPAGWLFDRLADHFGEAQIFKDIDSIEPGDDFVETITHAVGSCDVLLALIGDQWITIADAGGNRRLDDPSDFLRLEIEAALARDVRVIPVLVEGARMPRADELPERMATLVRRQALELSPSRFAADLARLLKVLDRTLTEREPPAAERSSDPPAAATGPQDAPVPPPATDAPVPPAATPPPPPAVPIRRRASDINDPLAASELPARARRPLPKSARVVMVVVTLVATLILVVALSLGDNPPSSSDGDETTEEEAPSDEAPSEEAPSEEAPSEEAPSEEESPP